jgi:hypothetical protein
MNITDIFLFYRGSDFVLQSRLAIAEKRLAEPWPADPHPLEFLVVIDFEATCDQDRPPGTYVQEIIEFPAVLVDIGKQEIVSSCRLLMTRLTFRLHAVRCYSTLQ